MCAVTATLWRGNQSVSRSRVALGEPVPSSSSNEGQFLWPSNARARPKLSWTMPTLLNGQCGCDFGVAVRTVLQFLYLAGTELVGAWPNREASCSKMVVEAGKSGRTTKAWHSASRPCDSRVATPTRVDLLVAGTIHVLKDLSARMQS